MDTTNAQPVEKLNRSQQYEQDCIDLRNGKMWSWAPGYEWAYRNEEELAKLNSDGHS